MNNATSGNNCGYTNLSDFGTFIATNKHIWYYIVDYLSIILVFSGFIINLIFILLSIRGIRSKILSYKLYIFLINRSTCDCIACLLIIVLRILITVQLISNIGVQLISMIFQLAFAVNCFTNFMLSLMRFVVVKWPIKAHIYFEARRCAIAIGVCWICVIILALIGYFLVTPNIRGNEFCQNNFDSCMFILKIIWIVCTGIAYMSVLTIFGITAYNVHLSNRSSPTDIRRHQSTPNSLRRLGISVAIFIVCNSLETPIGYLILTALPISRRSEQNVISNDPACLTNDDNRQLMTAYTMALIWALMIFIRMTADPLAGIIFDAKMLKLIQMTQIWQKMYALFKKRS